MTRAEITSRSNPRVRAWRDLRSRSTRDRTGRFLLEGERETLRALPHVTIVETIVRVDRAPIDLPGVVTVGPAVFDAISARQNPDGIAAVAETPDHRLEIFDPPRPRLVLVVDGVEKPGNLGAMIRTADALGAALLASEIGTDLVNPNVVRAAQGSLFGIPIATGDRDGAMGWCSDHGRVVVASPDAERSLWDTDLTDDVSVVIGSEHAGVDPNWLAIGEAVRIPMRGGADSLNASVSAAILLAEASRQRSG